MIKKEEILFLVSYRRRNEGNFWETEKNMKPEKHKLCEWDGSQCASWRGENFYVDVQHNAKRLRI